MLRCATVALTLIATSVRADDWPQWLGPQRDGVWREAGIIEKLPDQPNYRWRTKIGAGYAGPAVANGKVLLMDRILPEGTTNPEPQFADAYVVTMFKTLPPSFCPIHRFPNVCVQ